MSYSNSNSNFYVVPLVNRLFNLHNQFTDNEVLSSVNETQLRDFLDLNEPSHPFLFARINRTEDSGTSGLTERLMSRLERDKDYNFYDPFYSSTYSPYGSDYRISYDNYQMSTEDSEEESAGDYLTRMFADTLTDTQLSFSFMDDYSEDPKARNDVDENDNVLPFLPQDEHSNKEEE